MIKKGLIKHEFIEKEFCSDIEWNSRPPHDFFCPIDRTVWTQRDWDRTLLTKIQMLDNVIHKNTHQGGADTIRLGSEFWVMGLSEYFPLLNRWVGNDRKVGSLCNRWEVLLDFNVPYNEIWVCRERHTYGITVENTEGDIPTITFNHHDIIDKKKLRGRIRINE